MIRYLKILFYFLAITLFTIGCNQDQKPAAKPIDSTKVFTYDTLLANPGQADGNRTITKLNLRGDTVNVWRSSHDENGMFHSGLQHFNLKRQPVYSIDSVFNRNNILTELTRSIDSLSEYQHYFFNEERDTVKTLIGIHTQKYFVIFQRTHTSPPDYVAFLDGNLKSKIKVKETDFMNAQRSFNMKCEMVGMLHSTK